MPKITQIKQQIKRQDRYSIYVDGKYSFSLSEAEVAKLGLREDQELSAKALSGLREAAVRDKAYDRALRYLAIRPRSQFEITDYLKRKGYDQPLIEKLLKKLKKMSLVDDQAFAKQWVEWRIAGRPRSRRQLQAELIKKRIDRTIIEEVVSEIDSQTELDQLKALIERKSRLSQYQDRQRLISYLARQGYPYNLIKQALASNN